MLSPEHLEFYPSDLQNKRLCARDETMHAACTGKKAQPPGQRQTRHSLSNISTSTSASTSTVEDPNATLDVSDVSDVEEDDAVAGASDSDVDVAGSPPVNGAGVCSPELQCSH